MRAMRPSAVIALLLVGCAAPGDDGVPAAPARVAAGAGAVHSLPSLDGDSATPVGLTWNALRDRPRLVVGAFAAPAADDPEATARAVLARHADAFGLAGADLTVTLQKRGKAGTYVRFGERHAGLPVFDGEVVALVAAGGVRAVNLAHRGPFAAAPVMDDRGSAAAVAAMRGAIGFAPERRAPTVERGIAVGADGRTPRLAYRITVPTAVPRGTWQATVDAGTLAVAGLRDLRVNATGTGRVFDPNAVESTGDTALADSNDANQAALTAARFAVSLPNLDTSGFLRGTWVDAANTSTRASSPTNTYNFNRADDFFEEVMVYYHINRCQQRVQDLGIAEANNRVQVAAINAFADDNSFYDPSTLEVEFGTGGVDDAEDGDIVLHEYGHSMQHDQVPGWGASDDERAMGEGFGDYLGGGFSSTLATAAGHPGMVDPACVGEWDATSYSDEEPPCLRRLDRALHWPENRAQQQHADGEIWSGGLWAARATIGADTMDTLVIEHHFLLSTTESMATAADALVATDTNTFGGANTLPLRRALFARGTLRTPLAPPVGVPNPVDLMTADVANPTAGGVYANNLDDTQTITFPGAAAVRVHFDVLDLEEDSACLDDACDNLYVSDADGDLYQIIHGTAPNTVSATVPGDTIVLRLVTDGSVGRPGYHVDRIESMGDGPAAVDADPSDPDADPADPDAEPGTPDARVNPGTPDAEGGGGDGGGCCQGSARGSAPLALAVLALLLGRRRKRATA
jgi:hypothetical protein